MTHLKSLTLTVAPHQIERNPKLLCRQRLIERLEEQQKLAADPTFTVLVRRWIKDLDGVKQPFDRQKRVKPWWKAGGNGILVLVLKNGLKTMEIEKRGIVVGPVGRLETLTTRMAATKAGELEGALEAASGASKPSGTAKAPKQ